MKVLFVCEVVVVTLVVWDFVSIPPKEEEKGKTEDLSSKSGIWKIISQVGIFIFLVSSLILFLFGFFV